MKTLGTAGMAAALILATAFAPACKDDDDDDGDGDLGENTGSACESADECYPDVAEGELEGEPICMDLGEEGYCTHTCTSDADCCAADGECAEEVIDQLCAPFTSDSDTYCFLSCEDEDVPDGYDDANVYCQEYAHPSFICRSTGGGSENKKVCVPEG